MPKQTLAIIDRLRPLGLNDERFRRLHHLGGALHKHVEYCEETEAFTSRTNETVRRRLELVFAALSFDRPEGSAPASEAEWQAATLLAWNRFPM